MSQYATLTPHTSDPATCAHARRSMHDSHRCYDCGTTVTPEPERACVICGTPENGVYTSHNRCCWDADNIEEV